MTLTQFILPSGTLQSPEFPADIHPAHCIWVIQIIAGDLDIVYTLNYIDMKYSDNCYDDFLQV